jgi:hypothetical protein
VEVEPEAKWVYSNHGFAVLGQIVADVTGQSFDRYLRDHICLLVCWEHGPGCPVERGGPVAGC